MSKLPWRKQEDRLSDQAPDLNAKKVRRSGAGDLKGDNTLSPKARDEWMVEMKGTTSPRVRKMRVQRLWWERLLFDSTRELKRPILELEINHILVWVFTTEDLAMLIKEAVSLDALPNPSFELWRLTPAEDKSFTFDLEEWLYLCTLARNNDREPLAQVTWEKYNLCIVRRDFAMRCMRTAYGKTVS